MTNGSVPVAVVIAAKDEAADIADCIASVSWAREILVVENDSTDDTVDVARRAGAEVFSHPFTTIGAQRNAAIERARASWILVVDADERGTDALGAEVARIVGTGAGEGGGTRELVRGTMGSSASGAASTRSGGPAPRAYRCARRNFFFGREIRHGGWERDRPVRLFVRELRYDASAVHEHVEVRAGEAVGELREPLLHTPYATLDEYFEKLARYSRGWAAQHRARGRRASLGDLVTRPAARFVSMLFFKGGWRDGVHGVVLAVLAAMSVAAKYAQLWALERGGPPRKTR